MKRFAMISVVFLTLMGTSRAWSQDVPPSPLDNADRLFIEGKYEEAKRQYRLAGVQSYGRSEHIDNRIKSCDECVALLVAAQNLFNSRNIYASREPYEKILVINPSDPIAAARLRQIPDDGVTINGVTWATRNVGNTGSFVGYPQEVGGYYSFADAQRVCPAGWRLPSPADLERLRSAPYQWVDLMDIAGRQFLSGSKSIFIPITGMLNEAGNLNYPEFAFLWVSDGSPIGVSKDGTWVKQTTVSAPSRQYRIPVRCVLN